MDIESDEDRLYERELFLQNGPNNDHVTVYVKIVLRNIEAMLAHCEWADLPANAKTSFRKRVADSVFRAEFSEIARSFISGKDQEKKKKKLYTKFTKRHNKLDARRRKLMELYVEVRPKNKSLHELIGLL